jgi:hypothetical protein
LNSSRKAVHFAPVTAPHLHSQVKSPVRTPTIPSSISGISEGQGGAPCCTPTYSRNGPSQPAGGAFTQLCPALGQVGGGPASRIAFASETWFGPASAPMASALTSSLSAPVSMLHATTRTLASVAPIVAPRLRMGPTVSSYRSRAGAEGARMS